MKLSYSTRKLEKILTNERLIKKEYTSFYPKICNRISELRAAVCLNDISNYPPPRRHKLSGNKLDCWGVDISKNFRIIVKPIGDYNSEDLTSIVEIEVVTLEDYH